VRSLLLIAGLALLPGAVHALPGSVVQARKLEAGKAALERLQHDARRRRYRDGWEAVLRMFDRSVKAAPHGPRAAEAALAGARARAELWEVTRSRRDALSAIASLRKVDEDYPGPLGVQALASALRLAARANQPKERARLARRISERYPQDGKAIAPPVPRAAPAVTPPAPAVTPAAPAVTPAAPAVTPAEPAVTPAAPSLPPAQMLAESGEDDSEGEAPEVETEAAKTVEQIVDDARARASARAGEVSEEEETEELPEPEAPANPPMRSTPIVRAVKSAVAALTEPEDAPARATKAREIRSAALGAGTSLAAQLGLKTRRVVVDAGHGGKDTGAIGPRGVREKDLTLAIARRVGARLKSLGFEVVMTRKGDAFVSLDERTRIANEAHADLFVSIHCNAARRRKLEGVETWTLNVSSNRYAARLAAFENAEADRTVSDLRLILADLATKANASDARDLAQSVQSSLVRTLRSRVGPVRDHGVKQALFYVLLGTRMPSILVETGFISNPAEEARLKSARFQEGTAEAIARGVKEYVESRRRLARAP
jgi:N-acetylmuramoyl-L-alanine amidase